MGLGLVYSSGRPTQDLPALARRRLLALLVVAWEGNRLLALRLLERADSFRHAARAGGVTGLTLEVGQLQVLSGFARVRARELLEMYQHRGGRLSVRLPADAPCLPLEQELARIANLGRAYGAILDVAFHLHQDLEMVERCQHHVDELTDLVRQLDALPLPTIQRASS